MATLAANVVLRHPDTLAMHTFLAGDEVPEWARERITNPNAWSDDDQEPADAPDSPTPPPLGGPGSSRDAWARYAEAHGATVDPDASRDDIVDACRDAGIPVE